MADALYGARAAFTRGAWAEARAGMTAADAASPLAAEDLERLAVAAHLTGEDEESAAAWLRAHRAYVAADDPAGGARCAIWLAFGLLLDGEEARGGGWLARAGRLLDEFGGDGAERGLLLVPTGLAQLAGGDTTAAAATFAEATRIGQRAGDPDVVAFGRLGGGQVLIERGEAAAGVALLDEAMVAVTAGEVSPIVAGVLYCAVIEACQALGDVRRAREWTAALTRWCDAQPQLVEYRGQCRVHRAEIRRLHGEWEAAEEDLRRACERLAGRAAIGPAHYQRGELRRLRGDFEPAEEAYGEALREGFEPQPGMALLRLAQGRVPAAAAAIRRVADETSPGQGRGSILAAAVDIMVAAGDVGSARAAAGELTAMADGLEAPLLGAQAAQARGTVLLHQGSAGRAGGELRRALERWCEVEAPYEAACVRVLLAAACRQVGDHDTAAMELDAARSVFRRLGAAPDLARVDALPATAPVAPAGGLTGREAEVLVLVARGRTNREIAAELFISEHTVARHLQNIFVKLDVSSRTAAGAFAFENRLL